MFPRLPCGQDEECGLGIHLGSRHLSTCASDRIPNGWPNSCGSFAAANGPDLTFWSSCVWSSLSQGLKKVIAFYFQVLGKKVVVFWCWYGMMHFAAPLHKGSFLLRKGFSLDPRKTNGLLSTESVVLNVFFLGEIWEIWDSGFCSGWAGHIATPHMEPNNSFQRPDKGFGS